jgi:hypothetical protein
MELKLLKASFSLFSLGIEDVQLAILHLPLFTLV